MSATGTNRKERPGASKKIVFICLTVVLIAIGCMAVGEIYFRIQKPEIDIMAMTGRTPAINSMAQWAYLDAFAAYRAKPGKYMDAGKTVNSAGFVSTPEINKIKAPDEIRIAFLGESSTAGTGFNLADDQTWPWKTTAMLLGRFPEKKITFINAALGGYTSFESYGRLWSRVRFFNPDILVVNHGWNEMYYFSRAKMKEIEKWRTLPDGSWSFNVYSKTALYDPKWYDPLIRYSQLLSWLRLLGEKPRGGELPWGETGQTYTGLDPAAHETWRTNLKLFKAAAKTMGAKLFVCKQATMIVPSWKSDYQEKATVILHGFSYDEHIEAFKKIYGVIEDEIPAEDVIDLTVLSGKNELFNDHVHPKPEGTTEFARIVASKLAPYIETIYSTPTPENKQ